jgi:hypothetical protein
MDILTSSILHDPHLVRVLNCLLSEGELASHWPRFQCIQKVKIL